MNGQSRILSSESLSIGDIGDSLEFASGVNILITSLYSSKCVSNFVFGGMEVRVAILGVAKFIPSSKLTRNSWSGNGDNGSGSSSHSVGGCVGLGIGGISLGIGGIGIIQWGSIISKWGDSTAVNTRDSIMVRSHNGLGFLRKTNCQNGGENEQRLHGAICRDAKRQETPHVLCVPM